MDERERDERDLEILALLDEDYSLEAISALMDVPVAYIEQLIEET